MSQAPNPSYPSKKDVYCINCKYCVKVETAWYEKLFGFLIITDAQMMQKVPIFNIGIVSRGHS